MFRSGLLVAALVVSSGTVSAQSFEPGDLGLFFDPEATVRCGPEGGDPQPHTGVITPFVPFHFYVISFEVPGGQVAYEFSIDIDVRITPTVETFFPAGASNPPLQVGNIKNYIVGTGGTCYGNGTTEILVQWQALTFLGGADFLFCLGPSSPSSFTPEWPGYLTCDSPGELRRYAFAYEGCAVANSTACSVVGTSSTTWGALKATF